MWRPLQKALEPWLKTPGWEFDLLRTLPPPAAAGVYGRASMTARVRLMGTWRWWALGSAVTAAVVVSTVLMWVIAAALGFGPVGRVILEVVFHLSIGLFLFRPLVRLQESQMLPYLRTAVADELMDLAEAEWGSVPERDPHVTTGRAAPK